MDNNIIGTFYINFGIVGMVVDIKDEYTVILENVRIGRWAADIRNCTEYPIP